MSNLKGEAPAALFATLSTSLFPRAPLLRTLFPRKIWEIIIRKDEYIYSKSGCNPQHFKIVKNAVYLQIQPLL